MFLKLFVILSCQIHPISWTHRVWDHRFVPESKGRLQLETVLWMQSLSRPRINDASFFILPPAQLIIEGPFQRFPLCSFD